MSVVHDIVCEWSDSVMSDEGSSVAGILPDGSLMISLMTDQGRRMLSVPLGQAVPTASGSQVFRLDQIYPGVLKLRPSLLDPQLHAFITIVGAPVVGHEEENRRSMNLSIVCSHCGAELAADMLAGLFGPRMDVSPCDKCMEKDRKALERERNAYRSFSVKVRKALKDEDCAHGLDDAVTEAYQALRAELKEPDGTPE